MAKYTLCSIVMLLGLSLAGIAVAGEDPTLHQVYQAAESGRLDEAQAMMQKVLQDHPDSAKAHFVEAELLAKQGRLANAATELSRAEQIAPGLAFAKPASVEALKARLAGHTALPVSSQSYAGAPQSGGTSWMIMLLGGGLIASIIYFARALMRRNAPNYSSSAPPVNPGYGPTGSTYNGNPNAMPPGSSGVGSSMLGGLASGVAMGAGIVAGEALVHRMIDGGNRVNDPTLARQDEYTPPPDNMGGNDFGLSDSSSWDDNSSDSFSDSGGDSGGDWS